MTVKNILRQFTKNPDEKLNILVQSFDGIFEEMLSKTGHNIYVLPNSQQYPCSTTLTPNVKYVENIAHIPIDMVIDLVICNSRLTQYDQCKRLAVGLHIPLLAVDHHSPVGLLQQDDILNIRALHKVNSYVSIHSEITNEWWGGDVGSVIPYGIELDTSSTEKGDLAVTIGMFNPMEYASLVRIMESFGRFQIVNLATDKVTPEQINLLLSSASVYINFTMHNYIPIYLLSAMAHKCLVISSNVQILQKVFSSNSILFFSKVEELPMLFSLSKNPALRNRIIDEAFTIVKNGFSMSSFIDRWNTVLSDTVNNGYIE